jgi:hypothetical protein
MAEYDGGTLIRILQRPATLLVGRLAALLRGAGLAEGSDVGEAFAGATEKVLAAPFRRRR